MALNATGHSALAPRAELALALAMVASVYLMRLATNKVRTRLGRVEIGRLADKKAERPEAVLV
jgi:hypothetical protein